MLEIIDLEVEVDGKKILQGINLKFEKGKVNALMGPNGSGKSTLANVIMGHPKYKVTNGKIILDGVDITFMPPMERARAGLFLSFQHPQEYEGVVIRKFLRAIVNANRKDKLSVMDFKKLLDEKMELLGMDKFFSGRYLNHGFSGGEKKKLEMLQLLLLEPKYALLDETDSGLDVDAIRIVSEAINKIKENSKIGIVIITHYNSFLKYITPDVVSILSKGKIISQGGRELAEKIEKQGFGDLINGR